MHRQQCAGCDGWFTGAGHWCPKCKLELNEVSDNAKARTLLSVVNGGKSCNGTDSATTNRESDSYATDKV